LLKNIAKAFNKKAWLSPIPVSWMIFMAKLLSKEAVAVCLFSSLVVDNSKAQNLLGWNPVITMDEQLNKIRENEKII
jgi:nucleoside-diphosphate-sugar epimerase